MEPTSDEIRRTSKGKLRFFHFLDPKDAELLSSFLECRSVAAGEGLWREGDLNDFTVFLVSGKLEEKKRTDFGGKQVILGVYGKGAILGEFNLLENRPRPFSVRALEDTDLLMLSREDLEKLVTEHPQLGVKLFKGMLFAVSTRLRKSFERLASIF